MKTFTDNSGRSWSITINVATIKRVRDLLGINLLEAASGELLERLSDDPILLCDCIYVICKEQADSQKITDEDFGRCLGGDSLDGATTAFLEELVNFFPAGRRLVLAKIIDKMKAAENLAAELASKRLEAPELQRQIEKILRDSINSAGSLEPLPE